MKLSLTERLMLANQYRILEKLYPEEAETYRSFQRVLESGYEIHYSDLFLNFNEEPMDRETSNEVLKILSMYQDMQRAYKNSKDKSGVDPKELVFPGFDGNNEAELLSYARYYIEDLGRFQDLEKRDLNSHYQVIEMYRRMLAALDDAMLSVRMEDVRRILAAKIHPDHR